MVRWVGGWVGKWAGGWTGRWVVGCMDGCLIRWLVRRLVVATLAFIFSLAIVRPCHASKLPAKNPVSHTTQRPKISVVHYTTKLIVVLVALSHTAIVNNNLVNVSNA